ncbi:MAG: hypothetical protein NC293_07760 [Roseburia sp.]|nr:hypothetical protein [Roseburia sp.]
MSESRIYAGYFLRTGSYVENRRTETETEEPKDFKTQIAELAKKKKPCEMTLKEYREYLSEKIQKMCPFARQMSALVTVQISDMALVAMKNDPEYEKMVLEAVQYVVTREKDSAVEIELQIQRSREKKSEEKKQMQEILLKKKKIRMFFEKRKLRREAYTEFLETGERYVTPCPATEVFAAAQMTGGISIF